MRRALTLAAVLASPAAAQPMPASVVASPPATITVTVYRNPARARSQRMDLRFLGGFALITETRRVRLPAGQAVVRFEGVAGGIVPASALVTGLPGGTVEKNRDARLLSPAALIDGSLGRRVTLRRTDRATGVAREEEVEIVSGAPGVVVRTATGVEGLRCSGLAEQPRYPRVPPGLSAKPTLSVTTRSRVATTATVTLSYLSSAFDWSASYVATIAPDGTTLDLAAWMTLANGNAESFAKADVQAVAGRLERRELRDFRQAVGRLQLRCYPLGTTTSDLRLQEVSEDIVVTASRSFRMPSPVAVMAPSPSPPPPPPPPEDLGDLKLYRVPMAVTVAANQQKQVALLARQRVPFERVYRFRVYPGQTLANAPARIALRMRNRVDAGLGLALPAGSTALYGSRGGERLLVGTGTLADTAEGERVTLGAGISRQVTVEQRTDRAGHAVLTVANANPFPVTVELSVGQAGAKDVAAPSQPISRIDGVQTWISTIPANDRATLEYGF